MNDENKENAPQNRDDPKDKSEEKQPEAINIHQTESVGSAGKGPGN